MRFIVLCFFLVAAPCLVHAQREKLPLADLEYVEKTWPNAKKTSTGLRYIIEKEGQGQPPAAGDIVAVHYGGRFLRGNVFEENTAASAPFSFRVGRGLVIQGWDQIIQQMKPGEKRLVIIPSELAYGSHGQPPRIPGDSTLVFEIELVGVKRDS